MIYDQLLDEFSRSNLNDSTPYEDPILTTGLYYYTSNNRTKVQIKNNWQENPVCCQLDEKEIKSSPLLSRLKKGLSEDEIKNLLPFSFYITLKFKLKTNFFSNSDSSFFIVDNFMARDKIFGVPIVKPTTWKGNLKWMALKNLIDNYNTSPDIQKVNQHREQLIRLFGNENKPVRDFLNNKFRNVDRWVPIKENDNRIGRLRFFHTFLFNIDFDIINPHDRNKLSGTDPVSYEVVPKETEGIFNLLYLPYWYKNKNSLQEEFSEDIETVSDLLKDVMLNYGFSAKKDIGYGIIEDTFSSNGKIHYKISDHVKNETFNDFNKLREKIKKIREMYNVSSSNKDNL